MTTPNKPLAERVRPKYLKDYIGQNHLIGENGLITRVINKGNLPSLILWGPPGVGKTTLAQLLAEKSKKHFFKLSAIQAGVKEVRAIIDQSKKLNGVVLFIDEIHRFNKSQQDALLGAVESGIITLFGATTENPSFEVIPALLSRCQTYILKEHSSDDLKQIAIRALETDEYIKSYQIKISEFDALLYFSGGDARKLLNLIDLAFNYLISNDISNKSINNKIIELIGTKKLPKYDKKGENHYDVISAFIKSIRGSDPNAGVYWLARMLKAGEDPKFIARRLIILASEDIGNANPTALVLANNCFQSVNVIGMPESRIILSQTVVYLASSPKSNASYTAINNALQVVEKTGDLDVPLHLRNAPTKLMKDLNYGTNYKYAHDFENSFVEQEYMPNELIGKVFYQPKNNDRELIILNFLKRIWKNKYHFK